MVVDGFGLFCSFFLGGSGWLGLVVGLCGCIDDDNGWLWIFVIFVRVVVGRCGCFDDDSGWFWVVVSFS